MVGTTATFIISLDCEGKWGISGEPKPFHSLLTSENQLSAYRQLVATFARHDTPATFAFVMALTLTEAERATYSELLIGSREQEPWLKSYRMELAGGDPQGWHVPAALDIVREAGSHEIACHSFSHRPMDESLVSRSELDAELSAACEVARSKGLHLRTFVFPKNRVGHIQAVRDYGFIGYRMRLQRSAALSKSKALGRAFSVLEQFNVFARAQQPCPPEHGLVPVPAGHMFNWRRGVRLAVPSWVTVQRWRHQLDDAVRNAGVVHLWMHPHDPIFGPATCEMLDQVLAYAASLRDKGQLRIATMEEYSLDRLNQRESQKVDNPARDDHGLTPPKGISPELKGAVAR